MQSIQSLIELNSLVEQTQEKIHHMMKSQTNPISVFPANSFSSFGIRKKDHEIGTFTVSSNSVNILPETNLLVIWMYPANSSLEPSFKAKLQKIQDTHKQVQCFLMPCDKKPHQYLTHFPGALILKKTQVDIMTFWIIYKIFDNLDMVSSCVSNNYYLQLDIFPKILISTVECLQGCGFDIKLTPSKSLFISSTLSPLRISKDVSVQYTMFCNTDGSLQDKTIDKLAPTYHLEEVHSLDELQVQVEYIFQYILYSLDKQLSEHTTIIRSGLHYFSSIIHYVWSIKRFDHMVNHVCTHFLMLLNSKIQFKVDCSQDIQEIDHTLTSKNTLLVEAESINDPFDAIKKLHGCLSQVQNTKKIGLPFKARFESCFFSNMNKIQEMIQPDKLDDQKLKEFTTRTAPEFVDMIVQMYDNAWLLRSAGLYLVFKFQDKHIKLSQPTISRDNLYLLKNMVKNETKKISTQILNFMLKSCELLQKYKFTVLFEHLSDTACIKINCYNNKQYEVNYCAPYDMTYVFYQFLFILTNIIKDQFNINYMFCIQEIEKNLYSTLNFLLLDEYGSFLIPVFQRWKTSCSDK